MKTLIFEICRSTVKLTTFSLLFMAASLVAQSANGTAPEPGANDAEQSTRPETSDAASLQLIKNYLTVTGGKNLHDRLSNVVATGVIKEAGRTRKFKLIETQDGKRHLTYTWRHLGRDYEELYVFDGLRSWTQKKRPKLEDAQSYGGRQAAHFSSQRWLLQPFVLPSRADYVFAYQGKARVGGRTTHVVVGYGKKDERTWFYFDKEKSLLFRWGGIGSIGGVAEALDYRAGRFSSVDGVMLPKEIELLAEDAPFGRVTFETIQTNQDLSEVNFLMPQSSSPLLRQRSVPAK